MTVSIEYTEKYPVDVLTTQAALADAEVLGSSNGPGWTKVFLPNEASNAQITALNGVLASFDTLVVNATDLSIPNDDATPTVITVLTADAELAWYVLDSEGVLVGNGNAAAIAGVVTLNFKTSVADVYDIWVGRKVGDFATGMVRITVTES